MNEMNQEQLMRLSLEEKLEKEDLWDRLRSKDAVIEKYVKEEV